jgi:biotin carboxylase
LKSRSKKPCAAVFVDRAPFDLARNGQELSVAGLKTVLISASDPGRSIDSDYDAHFIADLYAPDQLAAVAADLNARFEVDFVFGSSETAVIPAAFIAARTHARGITPETAHKCRNKLSMREALTEADVPVPRFLGIRDSDCLPDAVAALGGFPIICKPLLGFASQGVQKVDDLDQLGNAVRHIKRMNRFVTRRYYAIGETASADIVLLEQFLPGQEYAIDGIVRHGRATLLLVIAKPDVSQGPLFADSMHIAPAQLGDDEYKALADTVQSAVTAVGIHTGPFHIEVRCNADGVYLLEIGARIGFPRLLRHTTGMDIMSLVINPLHDEDFAVSVAPATRYAGNLCINADKSGVFDRLANIDSVREHPNIEEVPVFIQPGERVAAPPDNSHYLAFVIASGASYAEVEQALAHAKQTLQPVIR